MGTTVQKLQRILETKTGFKNLITEKGGVITETTTFHEYIDEARKLMEGGKVVVEEASATAVPNTGAIDRVYFNTSLSTEEVDQIITNANLDWMDLETGAHAYAVCGTDTNNSVIIMAIPVSEGVYKYCIIGQGGSRDEPVISLAYVSVGVGPMMGVSGVEGWILGEGGIPDGFVSINGNLLSTDPGTKMPVGLQNEALKQIISITPFDGEPFHKELKGTYEPVTVEVTENSEVDLTTYMDEQKMPIKVNVNIEGAGDSGVPLQPATEEEMNNLLVNENIGKVFLYTGETNENFTNGEYYIIEEVTE